VLGTVLDASCSVGVLPLGILLPSVLDRVVALHGGTLLLADPVVVEVPASLQEVVDENEQEDKQRN